MLNGAVYVLTYCMLGMASFIAVAGGTWLSFGHHEYRPAQIAFSGEVRRPGHEWEVRRAAIVNDALWLVADGGGLWMSGELTEGLDGEPRHQAALDICFRGHQPVVIAAQKRAPTTWLLQSPDERGWKTLASVDSRGEGLVSLVCAADSLLILTTRRLIEVERSGARTSRLSVWIPSRPSNVVLPTPDHLWVAVDIGHYGGGLFRVDRRTGDVQVIGNGVSGEVCGLLDAGCFGVSGVVASPGKPGCIVAAIGSISAPTGGLAEICGGSIRLLHSAVCREPSEDPEAKLAGEPWCTEAYFGLLADRDRMIAVGLNGLTILESDGRVLNRPLPEFSSRGWSGVELDGAGALIVVRGEDHVPYYGHIPVVVPRLPTPPEDVRSPDSASPRDG